MTFGIIILTQTATMEFIQTKKNQDCSFLTALATLGCANLQNAHLLGVAFLQNAITESD